jgi:hypothetical protein
MVGCQYLRAMVILDVTRGRFICSWFENLGGSVAIFFCLLLRLRLVSSETSGFDRGRSKAGGE